MVKTCKSLHCKHAHRIAPWGSTALGPATSVREAAAKQPRACRALTIPTEAPIPAFELAEMVLRGIVSELIHIKEWEIIESLRLEKTSKIIHPSSPTVTSTPPWLLNHVPKCHIHPVFEPLQGWGLHHCPGQPGPVPDHSRSKETTKNDRGNWESRDRMQVAH